METKYTADDYLTEVSDYSDYQIWPPDDEEEGEWYEYEAEGKEFDERVEEKEKVKEKLKPPELIDIYADLFSKFRDIGAERIAAKTEERKEKLRQLIGLKEETEGSEETLITPEDESDKRSEESSEGSLYNCLRHIEISNSQLKLRNLHTSFPVPDDPGITPAFWILQEQTDSYSNHGVQFFKALVEKAKLQHIKVLEKMLLSNKIDLQYYGINPRIVRPLCEALMMNHTVEIVDLTGNRLSEDACYHLGELLQNNNTIHNLVLAGCRIGPKGAWRLQDGISDSQTLTQLDLSECNLGAEGFAYIESAVCQSDQLKELVLNDNQLDESCANDLQHLITASDTLTKLRLSWNSLYSAETWKKLGKAIEANEVLEELDLSWNALGNECVNYLRSLLSHSPSVRKLIMTGNRFNEEDAAIIARGLSKNETLEELHIGNNPLKAEGAFELIRAITPQVSPGSRLRVLDLSHIWAKKNALPELQAIEEGRPTLEVKLEGILSNHKIVGPDVMALIFKRANYEAMKPKRKQQRKNFGHFILSLEDGFVSRSRFLQVVKSFRLKLSTTLLDAITKAFAGPKNTVNLDLLKSIYITQYPDTEPPPEKPEKKKKTPKHTKPKKKAEGTESKTTKKSNKVKMRKTKKK
nr:protein NLRC5 isoform X1 [Megalopta genalis]